MQQRRIVLFYKVDGKLNDELLSVACYTDDQQAMDAAKKWILEQTKDMNIQSYLSDIRTGKYHKGYTSRKSREMVADYFAEFFSSEKAASPTCDLDFDCEPEEYDDENNTNVCNDNFSDFDVYVEAGATVLECHFGDHLQFDSTFMTAPYAEDGSYCLIKNDNGGFKFDIVTDYTPLHFEDDSSHSLNIFAVYRILNWANEPYTQEDIQSMFRELTDGRMSERTIGKHIGTLKALGFPITYVYKDEIWNEKLGYRLDKGSFKDISDVDASELGASAYVMLVLMALDRSDKAMTASEIMSYIREHFNVSISKAAMLRHLKSLCSICEAELTPAGEYYRR